MTAKEQERDLRTLNKIGVFLYGPRWQSEMARDTGRNERTVRSWVQGRGNVTAEVWERLDELLDRKIAKAPDVRDALNKKLATLSMKEAA